MRELIDMNNMAVCALQKGRPKKALNLLSAALVSLKDHVVNRGQQQEVLVLHEESTSMPTPTHITPPPSPPPTPTTPTTTEAPSHRWQLPRCVSDSSIATNSDWCGDEYDDESSLDVEMVEEDEEPVVPSVLSVTSEVISSHNDGLMLNYTKSLMVLHTLSDFKVLASVVLYNMAIVYHGRAIKRGSSTLLTEVLKLYKRAAHVIKIKQGNNRVGNFVLLVCYHNMAHIYSCRFCSEEMRECLAASRFLLSQASTLRFLDEDDMEFFLRAALLEDEDIRLAPAA